MKKKMLIFMLVGLVYMVGEDWTLMKAFSWCLIIASSEAR